MKVFAVRLKPEMDLKESLKDFVILNKIQSGFILTAVGSLKQANIRFANQNISNCFNEKFEIISLVGTLATTGIHLHLAISNQGGETIGGHLVEGCIIYTTAEIVIGESQDFTFNRSIDEETGFKELEIISKLE